MLITDCKKCKYYKNLIALCLGPRCYNDDNQQYKDGDYVGLVVISNIKDCKYLSNNKGVLNGKGLG